MMIHSPLVGIAKMMPPTGLTGLDRHGQMAGHRDRKPVVIGSSNGNVTMFLNATTSSGATVSLQVPFSLVK
jgi:FixJ family two-component response regulator